MAVPSRPGLWDGAAWAEVAVGIDGYIDAGSHTEYVLRVTRLSAAGTDGVAAHAVSRRFSAFRALHASLLVDLPRLGAFPLPRKFLPHRRAALERHRAPALADYLAAVLVHAAALPGSAPLPVLRAFLGLPPARDASHVAPSPGGLLRPISLAPRPPSADAVTEIAPLSSVASTPEPPTPPTDDCAGESAPRGATAAEAGASTERAARPRSRHLRAGLLAALAPAASAALAVGAAAAGAGACYAILPRFGTPPDAVEDVSAWSHIAAWAGASDVEASPPPSTLTIAEIAGAPTCNNTRPQQQHAGEAYVHVAPRVRRFPPLADRARHVASVRRRARRGMRRRGRRWRRRVHSE